MFTGITIFVVGMAFGVIVQDNHDVAGALNEAWYRFNQWRKG